MTRHLFSVKWKGAKPSTEPKLTYCSIRTNFTDTWVTPKNSQENVFWNLHQNIKFFFQEDAYSKVVCKMAAILLRPHLMLRPGWNILKTRSIPLLLMPWLFVSLGHHQQSNQPSSINNANIISRFLGVSEWVSDLVWRPFWEQRTSRSI